MTKYLVNRILRSLVSIAIVVAVVMVLIYSMLDKELVFAADPVIAKQTNNGRDVYKMQKWEEYGYLDYIPYSEWLREYLRSGELTQEQYDEAVKLGNKKDDSQDKGLCAEYVQKFREEMKSKGYEVDRKDAILKKGTKKYQDGGKPEMYAYKPIPLWNRLGTYVGKLITVDNIHKAAEVDGERGISFTLYDPAYGGEKFSPAIMGNGTQHKYLFYCDDNFPFIHQNLVKISLGTSYSVNKGVDVATTMVQSQGSFATSTITYPTGLTEESADDLHSATYVQGSFDAPTPVIAARFVDDYTNVQTNKSGLSKMGYSFSIGIVAVTLAYCLAVPLGMTMALRKGKLLDKLGTFYIVFITAVPSLAYIFMFQAIGGKIGLPTSFDMENPTTLMYVLPVISLALPSIANLMKWLRRYMIDQMNSDYVKFARSGGLSEGEIFSKHILKNAIIPVVHGIPGSILGAMTGAIITERVYVVPGAGNLLTNAINFYDNSVIVGVTLFYAILTVVSVILGDVLMSLVDPRISFTSKAR